MTGDEAVSADAVVEFVVEWGGQEAGAARRAVDRAGRQARRRAEQARRGRGQGDRPARSGVEAGAFEYYNGRKMLRAFAPAIAALTEEKDAYRDALLETQEQLMDLQAELRELRAVVLARHRADAELASLYRERAIARARAAERDPNAMLN